MHHLAAVLLALTALAAVAAQGASNGYLALCGTSSKNIPFSAKTTAASRLSSLCASLATGGDPKSLDLQSADPALLPMATFSSSWGAVVTASSSSVGARTSRTVISPVTVGLAKGAPLPPEVLMATAQGLTYPAVHLITVRLSSGAPVPASLWTLREVIVSNVTTAWDGDGPAHTLFLSALSATYRVWLQDSNTGAVKKYELLTCYNPSRGFASSTDAAC